MISKCRKHDCWPEWEPGGQERVKPEELQASENFIGWGSVKSHIYWVKPKGFYCPLCRLETLAEANPKEAEQWNQQQAEKEREGDDKATDK